MKAIFLEKAGGIENFIYQDTEQPMATEDQVLIKVKAIGINPVDYKVRMIEEVMTMICGEGYPIILGWDVAGEVVSVGTNITKFKAGDSVFGMVDFPGRGSAYAEYVAAPADHLAHIPANSSYEQAAATTLAALTALQALQSNVKSGDKVLIQAGSGGVGHFAIQIAKSLGAHVTTTSSAKNKDFVIALGADKHIDYRTQKFEELLSDLDFVLDAVGGDEMVTKSLKVLKDGGSMVSLPSPQFPDIAVEYAKTHNINLTFMMVTSNGDDMATLKEHLENGTIKPHISSTFAFEEMGKAHAQLESGRTVGRVVVTV